MQQNRDGNPADGDAPAKSDEQSRVFDFHELAAGAQEFKIQHEGQIYVLRRTKNGKLLLNK